MPATGAAFDAGKLCLAQAAAITAAVQALPDDVPAEIGGRAERELVDHADRFDAVQLSRLGQHILTVVAPEVGEASEAAALERQERQARLRRELTFTPDGHGTVFLRGRLTDEAAAIVRAALDPLARPLPGHRRRTRPPHRRATPRRRPGRTRPPRPDRGPVGHRRPCVGATSAASSVFVTIPLRTLTEGLGYALLPDGTPLSAGAARRMACDAQIIPAVLGTGSAVLDVGRAQRLFIGARRRALILRDRGCAFPGCDRPHSGATGTTSSGTRTVAGPTWTTGSCSAGCTTMLCTTTAGRS